MKKNLLLIFQLYFVINVFAQNNNYNIIYKIDTIKNNTTSIDSLKLAPFDTILYTPNTEVKTFLPEGYFCIENNNSKYTVFNDAFNIKIINNSKDFAVYIYSRKGEQISNALVTLNDTVINFDSLSNTYRVFNTSRLSGNLIVKYKEYIQTYKISSKESDFLYSRRVPIVYRYNSRFIKKSFYFIINWTPLKYVYFPLVQIVQLPKRIKQKKDNPNIKLYRFYNIEAIYNRLEKLHLILNPSLVDNYCIKKMYGSFQSKIIYNKPKYDKTDTLKAKIFIYDYDGNKIKKDIKILFIKHFYENEENKDSILNKFILFPNINGEYELEIPVNQYFLSDSKNGTYYTFICKALKGTDVYCSHNYHFDYDFDKNYLKNYIAFEVPKYVNNSNDTLKYSFISFQAIGNHSDKYTVKTYITIQRINEYLGSYEFISKNPIINEYSFSPNGICNFNIFGNELPNIDGEYKIHCVFLKNNIEYNYYDFTFSYLKSNKKYITITPNDSCIQINIYENNKLISTNAIIKYYNKQLYSDNEFISIDTVLLPCTIPYNPLANEISVFSQGISKSYDFKEFDNIKPYGYFFNDSVYIKAYNPTKISLWYQIFQDTIAIERGNTNNLNFISKATENSNYTLLLQYFWNGQYKSDYYFVNNFDKNLKISIEHPDVVNANDSVQFTILVKDKFGNPIPNVDITANAISKTYYDIDYEETFQKSIFSNNHILKIPSANYDYESRYVNNTIKLYENKIKEYNYDDSDYYDWIPPKMPREFDWNQFIPNNTMECKIHFTSIINNKEVYRVLLTNIEDSATIIKKGKFRLCKDYNNSNKDEFEKNIVSMYPIKSGKYFFTIIATDNSCWFSKVFEIKPNGITYFNVSDTISFNKKFTQHPLSKVLDSLNVIYAPTVKITPQFKNSYKTQIAQLPNGKNSINGYVFDISGNPLQYVIVTVKGTSLKDTTDENGKWSISTTNLNAIIQFNRIDFKSIERSVNNLDNNIIILDRNIINIDLLFKSKYVKPIIYEHSSSDMIYGTPSIMKKEKIVFNITKESDYTPIKKLYILNGEIYGFTFPKINSNDSIISIQNFNSYWINNQPTNICIIITKNGYTNIVSKNENYNTKLCDNAFWIPSVTTNKEGKATFSVVMPNQRSIWKIYVYANGNKQSGGIESLIITK